ncbi:patatin-like phospholipase family protein [Limnochorda pilosa]|uniref:Patatin n=1 Tax=Limnochorda pilosa TaxID=1555112 RepID=A0A0K2SPA3_LIMPI|nr:patatin-like phospholipase family protein [Limnochorda pilosa]BAS28827.1 patatin [Limnochorda pilosa]
MIRRPLAWVLSGGGAKAAYELGAMELLLERLPPPDLVCGSSAGALLAALLAEGVEAGKPLELLREEAAAWLHESPPLGLNWRGAWHALLRHGIHWRTLGEIPSIFSDAFLRAAVDRFLPRGRRFADYRHTRLLVTASNLETGRVQVFDEGSDLPVRETLLASLSYPLVFPSRYAQGSHLVDGGLLDNTPLAHVLRRGAATVVVVSLRPRRGPQVPSGPEAFDGAGEVAQRILALLLEEVMYRDLRRAVEVNELLALLEAYPTLPTPFRRQLLELVQGGSGERQRRHVQLVEISPATAVDPPGTFSFRDRRALQAAMERGRRDAEGVLARWQESPPGASKID